MSTATHISEEQYLRSSFSPDAEFVDGEIRERAMGTFDHADWQLAISMWFRQHADEWNIYTVPEQRVRIREGKYRIPDVAVLDRRLPIEQVVTHPPLAVFEVLSPDDTTQDLFERLADYAILGVPHIWLVDPKTSVFKNYQDGSLILLGGFSMNERSISFDFAEIRALLQNARR
jgi:Uma2 family endonuclease